MAATLTQEPSEWNLAYLPNVYVVSTATGLAEIQVEVEGTIVATLKQSENPAGRSMFDVSKILQSYLSINNNEEITKVQPSNGEVLTYRIKYGEVQSNGTVIYTGFAATKYVLNGYDNWRQLNWDETPFRSGVTEFACESPGYTGLVDQKRFLTNFPTEYSIRDNEYHTLSFFNWLENFTNAFANTQPYFVDLKFYNATGSLISQHAYSISDVTGLGPRTDCNDRGPYSYVSNEMIGHVGVGPQNIKDAGIIWYPQTASYVVSLYSLNECFSTSISDCDDIGELVDNYGQVMYQATFNIDDSCSPFEPIRLSFLNQYGVKDYFTFDRRNTYSVQTDRTNFQQVLGSWSSSSFSIDPLGRGQRTFSSAIKETMQLSTNWMTDQVSEWLQELYTSPSVMIYKDGRWEPCVIRTTQYEEKTNSRNRMFQHIIEVEYSNPKKVQRG